MSRFIPFLCVALAIVAAGCGFRPEVTRTQTLTETPTLQDVTAQEAQLTEQATALDRLSNDLMRRAMTRGAKVGAAAGCGLAVVSTSSGANCLAGALAGGTVGAVAGHAAGKKQVDARMELVSLSRVTPSITRTRDQMQLVEQGLPDLLASQARELATLRERMLAGELTETAFDARVAEIKQSRAMVAEALSLSASNARAAHKALAEAKSDGQTGLDWHLMMVGKLEKDALSARSSISLL